MFKSNSIFRKVAAFLVMVMVFMGAGNSFVFAQELADKGYADSNCEIVTFDEGTFKYEYITDGKLGEVLRITNLDTNEEQLVFNDNDNVYVENENKEISVVAKIVPNIYKSKLSSILSVNSDWTNFGPDRYYFDLVDVTQIGVAAGIIAFALGNAPVAAIKIALGAMTPPLIYNGVYADKWGRYRFVGTMIEGEYTSQLYQPTGRTLGFPINWSGKR